MSDEITITDNTPNQPAKVATEPQMVSAKYNELSQETSSRYAVERAETEAYLNKPQTIPTTAIDARLNPVPKEVDYAEGYDGNIRIDPTSQGQLEQLRFQQNKELKDSAELASADTSDWLTEGATASIFSIPANNRIPTTTIPNTLKEQLTGVVTDPNETLQTSKALSQNELQDVYRRNNIDTTNTEAVQQFLAHNGYEQELRRDYPDKAEERLERVADYNEAKRAAKIYDNAVDLNSRSNLTATLDTGLGLASGVAGFAESLIDFVAIPYNLAKMSGYKHLATIEERINQTDGNHYFTAGEDLGFNEIKDFLNGFKSSVLQNTNNRIAAQTIANEINSHDYWEIKREAGNPLAGLGEVLHSTWNAIKERLSSGTATVDSIAEMASSMLVMGRMASIAGRIARKTAEVNIMRAIAANAERQGIKLTEDQLRKRTAIALASKQIQNNINKSVARSAIYSGIATNAISDMGSSSAIVLDKLDSMTLKEWQQSEKYKALIAMGLSHQDAVDYIGQNILMQSVLAQGAISAGSSILTGGGRVNSAMFANKEVRNLLTKGKDWGKDLGKSVLENTIQGSSYNAVPAVMFNLNADQPINYSELGSAAGDSIVSALGIGATGGMIRHPIKTVGAVVKPVGRVGYNITKPIIKKGIVDPINNIKENNRQKNDKETFKETALRADELKEKFNRNYSNNSPKTEFEIKEPVNMFDPSASKEDGEALSKISDTITPEQLNSVKGTPTTPEFKQELKTELTKDLDPNNPLVKKVQERLDSQDDVGYDTAIDIQKIITDEAVTTSKKNGLIKTPEDKALAGKILNRLQDIYGGETSDAIEAISKANGEVTSETIKKYKQLLAVRSLKGNDTNLINDLQGYVPTKAQRNITKMAEVFNVDSSGRVSINTEKVNVNDKASLKSAITTVLFHKKTSKQSEKLSQELLTQLIKHYETLLDKGNETEKAFRKDIEKASKNTILDNAEYYEAKLLSDFNKIDVVSHDIRYSQQSGKEGVTEHLQSIFQAIHKINDPKSTRKTVNEGKRELKKSYEKLKKFQQKQSRKASVFQKAYEESLNTQQPVTPMFAEGKVWKRAEGKKNIPYVINENSKGLIDVINNDLDVITKAVEIANKHITTNDVSQYVGDTFESNYKNPKTKAKARDLVKATSKNKSLADIAEQRKNDEQIEKEYADTLVDNYQADLISQQENEEAKTSTDTVTGVTPTPETQAVKPKTESKQATEQIAKNKTKNNIDNSSEPEAVGDIDNKQDKPAEAGLSTTSEIDYIDLGDNTVGEVTGENTVLITNETNQHKSLGVKLLETVSNKLPFISKGTKTILNKFNLLHESKVGALKVSSVFQKYPELVYNILKTKKLKTDSPVITDLLDAINEVNAESNSKMQFNAVDVQDALALAKQIKQSVETFLPEFKEQIDEAIERLNDEDLEGKYINPYRNVMYSFLVQDENSGKYYMPEEVLYALALTAQRFLSENQSLLSSETQKIALYDFLDRQASGIVDHVDIDADSPILGILRSQQNKIVGTNFLDALGLAFKDRDNTPENYRAAIIEGSGNTILDLLIGMNVIHTRKINVELTVNGEKVPRTLSVLTTGVNESNTKSYDAVMEKTVRPFIGRTQVLFDTTMFSSNSRTISLTPPKQVVNSRTKRTSIGENSPARAEVDQIYANDAFHVNADLYNLLSNLGVLSPQDNGEIAKYFGYLPAEYIDYESGNPRKVLHPAQVPSKAGQSTTFMAQLETLRVIVNTLLLSGNDVAKTPFYIANRNQASGRNMLAALGNHNSYNTFITPQAGRFIREMIVRKPTDLNVDKTTQEGKANAKLVKVAIAQAFGVKVERQDGIDNLIAQYNILANQKEFKRSVTLTKKVIDGTATSIEKEELAVLAHQYAKSPSEIPVVMHALQTQVKLNRALHGNTKAENRVIFNNTLGISIDGTSHGISTALFTSFGKGDSNAFLDLLALGGINLDASKGTLAKSANSDIYIRTNDQFKKELNKAISTDNTKGIPLLNNITSTALLLNSGGDFINSDTSNDIFSDIARILNGEIQVETARELGKKLATLVGAYAGGGKSPIPHILEARDKRLGEVLTNVYQQLRQLRDSTLPQEIIDNLDYLNNYYRTNELMKALTDLTTLTAGGTLLAPNKDGFTLNKEQNPFLSIAETFKVASPKNEYLVNEINEYMQRIQDIQNTDLFRTDAENFQNNASILKTLTDVFTAENIRQNSLDLRDTSAYEALGTLIKRTVNNESLFKGVIDSNKFGTDVASAKKVTFDARYNKALTQLIEEKRDAHEQKYGKTQRFNAPAPTPQELYEIRYQLAKDLALTYTTPFDNRLDVLNNPEIGTDIYKLNAPIPSRDLDHIEVNSFLPEGTGSSISWTGIEDLGVRQAPLNTVSIETSTIRRFLAKNKHLTQANVLNVYDAIVTNVENLNNVSQILNQSFFETLQNTNYAYDNLVDTLIAFSRDADAVSIDYSHITSPEMRNELKKQVEQFVSILVKTVSDENKNLYKNLFNMMISSQVRFLSPKINANDIFSFIRNLTKQGMSDTENTVIAQARKYLTGIVNTAAANKGNMEVILNSKEFNIAISNFSAGVEGYVNNNNISDSFDINEFNHKRAEQTLIARNNLLAILKAPTLKEKEELREKAYLTSNTNFKEGSSFIRSSTPESVNEGVTSTHGMDYVIDIVEGKKHQQHSKYLGRLFKELFNNSDETTYNTKILTGSAESLTSHIIEYYPELLESGVDLDFKTQDAFYYPEKNVIFSTTIAADVLSHEIVHSILHTTLGTYTRELAYGEASTLTSLQLEGIKGIHDELNGIIEHYGDSLQDALPALYDYITPFKEAETLLQEAKDLASNGELSEEAYQQRANTYQQAMYSLLQEFIAYSATDVETSNTLMQPARGKETKGISFITKAFPRIMQFIRYIFGLGRQSNPQIDTAFMRVLAGTKLLTKETLDTDSDLSITRKLKESLQEFASNPDNLLTKATAESPTLLSHIGKDINNMSPDSAETRRALEIEYDKIAQSIREQDLALGVNPSVTEKNINEVNRLMDFVAPMDNISKGYTARDIALEALAKTYTNASDKTLKQGTDVNNVDQLYNMSPSEKYLYESKVALLTANFEINPYHADEATKLFNSSKNQLTPSDFKDSGTSTETAQKRYDSLFKNYKADVSNKLKYNQVSMFMALADTVPFIQEVLGKVDANTNRSTDPNSKHNMSIVGRTMSKSFGLLSKAGTSSNVNTRLDSVRKNIILNGKILKDNLANDGAKRKDGLFDRMPAINDKAVTQAQATLHDILNKKREETPEEDKYKRLGYYILSELTKPVNLTEDWGLSDYVTRQLMKHGDKPLSVATKLLIEVIGATPVTRDFYAAMNQNKQNFDKLRKITIDTLPSYYKSQFDIEPTKAESIQMKRDILDAKLNILHKYFGDEMFKELILSDEKLEDNIASVAEKISSEQVHIPFNIDSMANYLAHGIVSTDLHINNTNYEALTGYNVISDVEALTVLKAFSMMETPRKEFIRNLVNNEFNGLSKLMEGIESITADKDSVNQRGSRLFENYENNNPNRDIVVAPKADLEKMLAQGYKLSEDLDIDSSLSGMPAMSIYVSDINTAPYRAGAVHITNTSNIGSKVNNDLYVRVLGLNDWVETNSELLASHQNSINTNTKALSSRTNKNNQDMNPFGYKDSEFFGVLNAQNDKVGAFKFALNRDQVRNALGTSTDIFDALGRIKGRIQEDSQVLANNIAIFKELKRIYALDMNKMVLEGINPDIQYINLMESEIPQVVEFRKTLSPRVLKVWAKHSINNKIMLRKDLLDNIVGYRDWSPLEMFKKDPEARTKIENAVVDISSTVLGNNAAKYLTNIARIAKEATVIHKFAVVVLNFAVVKANILSNVTQLMTHGISPLQTAKDTALAVEAAQTYANNSHYIAKLKESRSHQSANIKYILSEIANEFEGTVFKNEQDLKNKIHLLTNEKFNTKNNQANNIEKVSLEIVKQLKEVIIDRINKNTNPAIIQSLQDIHTKIEQIHQAVKERNNIDNNILTIEEQQKRNPVATLIEAGLMPTISDDLTVGEEHTILKKRVKDIFSKFDTGGSKSMLVGGIKNMFGTNDSTVGKFLYKTNQLVDFTSKYTLFKELTTRRHNRFDEKQALDYIREEFVNYDILPSRLRNNLENLGLTQFMNYMLRSAKISVRNIQDNPLRGVVMFSAWLETGMPTIWDSNPFYSGLSPRLGGNWFDNFRNTPIGQLINSDPVKYVGKLGG